MQEGALIVSRNTVPLTGYLQRNFGAGGIDHLACLVHPDDLDGLKEEIGEAAAKKRTYQLNYRIRIASGQYRWVSDTGTVVLEKGVRYHHRYYAQQENEIRLCLENDLLKNGATREPKTSSFWWSILFKATTPPRGI